MISTGKSLRRKGSSLVMVTSYVSPELTARIPAIAFDLFSCAEAAPKAQTTSKAARATQPSLDPGIRSIIRRPLPPEVTGTDDALSFLRTDSKKIADPCRDRGGGPCHED